MVAQVDSIMPSFGVWGLKLNIEELGMEPGWNSKTLLLLTHTHILKMSTVP